MSHFVFEDYLPDSVEIDMSSGLIVVQTPNPLGKPSLSLEPEDPASERALDLIERTKISRDGNTLRISVPTPPGVSISSRRGGITVSGGTIVSGSNVTIVNDQVIGGTSITRLPSDGIKLVLRVPEGVDLHATSISADVDAYQALLGSAHIHCTSGDIRIGTAASVDANTTSGDVVIRKADRAYVRTASGDVKALNIGERGELHAVSGDLDAYTQTKSIIARTVSGDIQITHPPGISLSDSVARTVSGRTSVYARR